MGLETRGIEALSAAIEKLEGTGKRGAVFSELLSMCPSCIECMSFLAQLGVELQKADLIEETKLVYGQLARTAALKNHPIEAILAVRHLEPLSNDDLELLPFVTDRYSATARRLAFGTIPITTSCGLPKELAKVGDDFDIEVLVDTVLEECGFGNAEQEDPSKSLGYSAVPFFSDLQPVDFAALCKRLSPRTLTAGQPLLTKGDISPGLFWFGKGCFSIDDELNAPVTVDGTHLLMGFGGHQNQPSKITILTLEPCEGLFLANDALTDLLATHASMRFAFAWAEQRARIHQTVARSALFAGLPTSVHGEILARAQACTVRAKEILIKQGESSPGLFVVISGQLKHTLNKAGNNLPLVTLSAGEASGLLGIGSGESAPFSATVVADGSVLFISRQDLEYLLSVIPAFKKVFRKLQQDLATEILSLS